MQKDFITVTPDSGNSGGSVSVEADMNPQFKGRETTLTFSATGGLSKSVKATQEGIPYIPVLYTNMDLPQLKIGSNGELMYEINFTKFNGNLGLIKLYQFIDVTSQIETIEGELYNNNKIELPKEESQFEFENSGDIKIWKSNSILYFLLAAAQNPSNIKGNNSYLKVWINGKLVQNISLTK